MSGPNQDPPRGVLHRNASEQHYQLSRFAPAKDMCSFVECYWIVRWDLRGRRPHRQENLPHPCVHVVAESNQIDIYGVVEGKFSRLLEGRGRIFGIKFHSGGFFPFIQHPVSELTNRVVPLVDAFGTSATTFGRAILTAGGDACLCMLADEFLRAQNPQHDENITKVREIAERVVSDRTITRVDDLLRIFDVNKRTLQRWFNKYVGVSPKWAIQRYRLHEALSQLEPGAPPNWPGLALDLGYSDQAHFINDFKRRIGTSPTEYLH